MSTVTVKRPKLVKEGPKTKYVTLNVGEGIAPVRVTVIPEVHAEWDNIETLEVGKVHYDQGRDPMGDGTDEPSEEFAFDRWEIIDFATTADVDRADAREDKTLLRKMKNDAMTKKFMKETSFEDVDAALEAAV